MRMTIAALFAGLLMLPAAAPALASGSGAAAQAVTFELSAATKKPMPKAAKKTTEKIEYMRAVPAK